MTTSTIDNPFEVSIIIYIIVISLLFIVRPNFIFNNPKIYYKFGLADKNKTIQKKTLIPLWLLFIILALVIYYSVIAMSSA